MNQSLKSHAWLRYLSFAGLACLLMAWLDPSHFRPWAAASSDALSWLALLLLTGAGLASRLPLQVPRLALGILLLGLWPLAQWASGVIFFFGDALLVSVYLMGLAWAIALAFGSAEQNPAFVDWLASTIVAGALLSLLAATCQWLGIELAGWVYTIEKGMRPYGNLAQPNNLASLLLMGCAAALYLRLAGKWRALPMALVIALLLAGVAMSRSRMALLALFVLTAWLWAGRKRLHLPLSGYEIAAIALGGAGLWLVWPTFSAFLGLPSVGSWERLTGVSNDLRLTMLAEFLDAAWQRPFSGWGWNQVSVAHLAVAPYYPHNNMNYSSHNLFVDLMVWVGGVGGLLLSLFILAWAALRLRQVNTLPGWFALAAVLILGTHAQFEYPLDYAFFLVPCGLCIGIVEAGVGARHWRLPGHVAIWPLLLGTTLLVTIAREYIIVQADYQGFSIYATHDDWQYARQLAPDLVLLTQAREHSVFAKSEAKEGLSDADLAWMRQVATRNPHPYALLRYALALGLNGRPQEAGEMLIALRQMHPPLMFNWAMAQWQNWQRRYPVLEQVKLPAPDKDGLAEDSPRHTTIDPITGER